MIMIISIILSIIILIIGIIKCILTYKRYFQSYWVQATTGYLAPTSVTMNSTSTNNNSTVSSTSITSIERLESGTKNPINNNSLPHSQRQPSKKSVFSITAEDDDEINL
jgi:hypothetical protein